MTDNALATDARPTAEDLFTNRLYAGQIGTGKSVTIGRDIRTLLDAERDYRVIDISLVPWYDRPDLEDEYGTFCDKDDLENEASHLSDGLESREYLRIDAEYNVTEADDQAVRHALDHAYAAAKDSEYPTVIVVDNLPRGVDRGIDRDALSKEIAEYRSHGVALWVSECDPFEDGFAEKWTNSSGKVVLHSRLSPESTREANLSDDEVSYVSPVPTPETGSNQVLVGDMVQWRKETVELTE